MWRERGAVGRWDDNKQMFSFHIHWKYIPQILHVVFQFRNQLQKPPPFLITDSVSESDILYDT